jgi:hypothetical protein
MSKRNFILLVIVLMIILLGVVGYWYMLAQQVPPSTEKAPGFLAKFNPFSPNPLPNPTPTPASETQEGTTTEVPVQNHKLIKVSNLGVAGYGVFDKERLVVESPNQEIPPVTSKPLPPKTEFVPALRYVDRITGNIFETFADKIDERQFSNTSIPKIYEAWFGNKGQTVIMRYLRSDDTTIETFVGALPKEVLGGDSSEPHAVTGTYLPQNITDLSVSGDGTHAFYILHSFGNAMGITLDLATNKKVQIFESAFTEWLTSWSSNKIITLTTKPSANVVGYTYVLDPVTKSFTRVLSNIDGLTSLASPNGKTTLYSDSNLGLGLFYMVTGATANTGLRTMPEKCVWGIEKIYCAVPRTIPVGQYPDSWYSGEVSFNDQIWSIDPEAGTTTLILDPASEAGGKVVDGIKLSLDAGEKFLFFVNKADSSLWEFKLN